MKTRITASLALLTAFTLWTTAVCFVDVQTVGPQNSAVGFATLNRFVHALTGVHLTLYHVTDWLGLVPVAVCLGFAVLGLVQWIARRSLFKVDRDLFILGGFYIAVIAAYLLFEEFAVNYRPVLIDGFLEASYPSSTTLLVLCVMPTASMQLKRRVRHRAWRTALTWGIAVFTIGMVVGRMLSGVHWLTDIVGGVLLSAALVTAYQAFAEN